MQVTPHTDVTGLSLSMPIVVKRQTNPRPVQCSTGPSYSNSCLNRGTEFHETWFDPATTGPSPTQAVCTVPERFILRKPFSAPVPNSDACSLHGNTRSRHSDWLLAGRWRGCSSSPSRGEICLSFACARPALGLSRDMKLTTHFLLEQRSRIHIHSPIRLHGLMLN
jgi:hypothetical protein